MLRFVMQALLDLLLKSSTSKALYLYKTVGINLHLSFFAKFLGVLQESIFLSQRNPPPSALRSLQCSACIKENRREVQNMPSIFLLFKGTGARDGFLSIIYESCVILHHMQDNRGFNFFLISFNQRIRTQEDMQSEYLYVCTQSV